MPFVFLAEGVPREKAAMNHLPVPSGTEITVNHYHEGVVGINYTNYTVQCYPLGTLEKIGCRLMSPRQELVPAAALQEESRWRGCG